MSSGSSLMELPSASVFGRVVEEEEDPLLGWSTHTAGKLCFLIRQTSVCIVLRRLRSRDGFPEESEGLARAGKS